jgi:serine/threonine protein kinase
MGIVYLAKDPLIGRLVALKTIRSAAHADDDEAKEFQQRFIREAQAAGILNHPSIVTVHDIGQDDGTNTSFIAMEYVEGNNLKEVLQQGRPLTFEEIGDIIAQVGDALDFAHAKGIVHRDVKPANIILLEGNRAKITDFGIAKIASGGANLTSTGQFLGTPNYMAPEQIKGAPVDGRTDIFALGICLYECLTRRKPFGGDSLTSISYKIVHEPFPPLRELNPQIPEGYDEVIGHCLAKDPSKRYQRAKELATAVRQVIRGERPVKVEPMLADETIITRTDRNTVGADRDKLPTMEVPFPEAAEASPDSQSNTQPARNAAAAAAAAAAGPRVPRPPLKQQLHKTLSNVRAFPLWRRRLHPALFFGLVAILVAGLLGAMVIVQKRHPVIPAVDKKAEAQRTRERQLRREGEALLAQGRVTEAYARYMELSKLAPKSPYVSGLIERLNAMRQQEEITKQQATLARQKYDEGFALFNQKKYPEAILVLQESFNLNPTASDTANYLKLAQQEQQKLDAAKLARKSTGTKTTTTDTRGRVTTATQTTVGPVAGDGGTATTAPAGQLARLTTVFNSPYADGTILVKVGADVIARENLWEERGRLMFRRKYPRAVSVTKELMPKNADVQIWITIPTQKIQEYHTIPAARFNPGSSHRLSVTFDQASKKFDYQLN